MLVRSTLQFHVFHLWGRMRTQSQVTNGTIFIKLRRCTVDLSRWSSWGIFRGLRPLNPTRTIMREWIPSSTPAEIHLKVRVTVNSARGLPVRQKDPLKYGLHLTCMKTTSKQQQTSILQVGMSARGDHQKTCTVTCFCSEGRVVPEMYFAVGCLQLPTGQPSQRKKLFLR